MKTPTRKRTNWKTITEAVTAVQQKHGGRLSATLVLDEAKAKTHPLHNQFIWNNTIAGHKYRLIQARALIRRVKIISVHHAKVVTSVRFIRDPNAGAKEQGYKSIETISTVKADARRAIVAEFLRVEAILTRARNIASTLGLSDQLEDLVNQVTGLRHAVARRRTARKQNAVA